MAERDNQKTFTFWLDKIDMKELKQLALDQETNVSELVRQAIKKVLEENKNK